MVIIYPKKFILRSILTLPEPATAARQSKCISLKERAENVKDIHFRMLH